MEQTQKISNERLAELLNSRRRLGICVKTVREMAGELLQARRELKNGEEMYTAMRGRCARVESDLEPLRVSHKRMVETLEGASHALRSYQYGNVAAELAKGVADTCDAALAEARELEGK